MVFSQRTGDGEELEISAQWCGTRYQVTMRGFADVLEATVKDWPDVPDEAYWTLVSVPFLTLVACCVWLRVVWPCPEAAPKEFTPATLLENPTESSSLQGTSAG